MLRSLRTWQSRLFIGGCLLALVAQAALAQTTAFTYQGKLTDAGNPATGIYDLQFRLFDALVGGNQVGTTLIREDVSVSSGIFTTTLDFGAAAFPGANRFLEIGVRPGVSTGSFTPLTPLQPITSTPYAVQSLNAANATNATTAVHFSGALAGDVTGNQSTTTLAANAVTTTKLADGSVTDTKISVPLSLSGNNAIQIISATNTRSTGTSYGIFGSSNSSQGIGVVGQATSTTGPTFGVSGVSSSDIGTGVSGYSNGNSGTGVSGWAASLSGNTFGVNGRSDSNNGNGVYGYAASMTGATTGVFGQSNSSEGSGIFGWASSPIGSNYGVFGSSNSNSGRGVFGYSSGGYGVFGQSNSGFAGYFDGKLYAAGSVGIGTTTPGANLSVDGIPSTVNVETAELIRLSRPAVSGVKNTNSAGIFLGAFESGILGRARLDIKLSGTPMASNSFGIIPDVTVMSLLASGGVGIGTTTPDQLLSVNGNASKSVGGTTWAVFSDERLKNIKGRFTPGLSTLLQLQPIRYEYKPDNTLGLPSGGEAVGFSAQAVEQVLPEAVSRTPQGYLQLNSDPILWTMLNAIKEQQELITKQQAQIDALKKLACQQQPNAALCH